ncbi:MAG: hypothetical protein EU530_04385 [Promethearchaeota archaeon]|nr:MAG: hypothetical protein EU530_04385 [Candidatus Lokiarchaeota archaeon]
MSEARKEFQYFIISPVYVVESLLDFLRTEFAQSAGIIRDPEVKIMKIDEEETRHVPILITNLELKEKSLHLLKKEIAEEIDIISLPWKNEWLLTRTTTNLHENLREILSPDILEYIPQAFDTIGNLAILELDRWGEISEIVGSMSEVQNILSLVGETIIKLHKNITTVLRKGGNISGEYRVRKYEMIAGSNQTSTLHKENNCMFHVDPTKMFFSSRLSFERNRVSSLEIKKNSLILDCFAGCGPFSVQIAHNHDVKIFGVEKNPDAFDYFKKNVVLNSKRLIGSIYPFLGDFRDFYNSNEGKFCLNKTDYIIMNLPERVFEFIPDIVPYVRNDNTYLILYTFLKSSNPLEDTELILISNLQDNNICVKEIVQKRIVFSYSPNQNNICIDVKIRKKN